MTEPLSTIVLGPGPGEPGSERPPVRMFVGTEPAQHRALRVFVWSIEQVRDPARRYEIHLLEHLHGFSDASWLTGFTNYRFAIPHFAGGVGRAIYNDVDQIYLRDPAELFDLDMEGRGYQSINDRDTSVMLIDCERMAPVWTLELARKRRRKAIEARARKVPGLWGPLEAGWNARDTEIVELLAEERAYCVHFTTIHTQPWMPFPGRFVYQANPVGHLWHDLEASADEAGFELFSEAHPSAGWRRLLAAPAPDPHPETQAVGTDRDAALARVDAASVLEWSLDGSGARTAADLERNGCHITRYDPSVPHQAKQPRERFDAVVFRGGLERVSDEDLPWLVDSLFRYARRLVHVRIRDDAPHPDGARAGERRDRFFWSRLFAEAGARHPRVAWQLAAERGLGGRRLAWRREGLASAEGAPSVLPKVWVLEDDKAGHSAQSQGLAAALGWPVETRRLRFNLLNRLSNRLLGASAMGLAGAGSDALAPPWPDLVIATGRRCAPVARWVARQSQGHTRVVLIGRKGGDAVADVDLAVSCRHFRQLPHGRRFETLAPMNAVNDAVLAEAAERWAELRDAEGRAPVGLVVGGDTAHHRLDAAEARKLGAEVRAFARDAGRRLVVVTSPRTPEAAAHALAQSLDEGDRLLSWSPDPAENAYLGVLALADPLVVTGDSESMLGEALAAGRPVFVRPLPGRPPKLGMRVGEWFHARAHARPRKRGKGSVRPQRAPERWFALALRHGLVRPPRDLEILYDELVARGLAQRFGAPFAAGPRPPLREVEGVARRVARMLGRPRPEPASSGGTGAGAVPGA